MGKGETTKISILHRAVGLAGQFGLEGLSIGALAKELALSKSGLFAHFRSKETLQKQVLDAAAEEFARRVVRPALAEPRGERRNRALFENWLAWTQAGGCIFVTASVELDDRPGPLRDHLVKLQKDWQDIRVRVARTGVETGDFRRDLDCEQFAHDSFGVMLACHHSARLFRDPRAVDRARDAFERLIKGARP
jgi:AcrR family transcriptional regulator